MPSNSQEQDKTSLFSKLASLVFLLAGGLYFTGWTYRWIYFGLFQIEVPSLNLPIESFYLAAFQGLFGSFWAIIRSVLAVFGGSIAIHVSLWIIDRFIKEIIKPILNWIQSRLLHFANRRQRSWLAKQLYSFANFSSLQLVSIQFIRSLINELVIVFWALAILLWLARQQAYFDARADVVNETSTLPIITVVASEENMLMGRKPEDKEDNPTGIRIIGDERRYINLLGKELTELNNTQEDRVWRLLLDRNGYFYFFPAPTNQEFDAFPTTIMIHEGSNGDRLVILSPKTS